VRRIGTIIRSSASTMPDIPEEEEQALVASGRDSVRSTASSNIIYGRSDEEANMQAQEAAKAGLRYAAGSCRVVQPSQLRAGPARPSLLPLGSACLAAPSLHAKLWLSDRATMTPPA
jgi:hypothetical protein